MITNTTEPEILPEIKWAIQQYIRLGFSEPQTIILISESVDYHDAERLLNRGCPSELAVEILRA